jgi:dGTPase
MTDLYEELLAPYACWPSQSQGRLYPEKPSIARNAFQRDRDRIIHSTAFRRLKDKTQVFVVHEGDHYRTRLTHSLEVAQIARSLARALRVQEDLAEAIGLAHDLGHPPFAHTGEDVLQECLEPFGGFNHNDQSLRIVTKLEKRYADFDGLNLSWEILEGMAKHNGPVTKQPIPPTIAIIDKQMDLKLGTFAGLEAQIANLSDDIAYNNHDIDDGLRAGLLQISDLCDVPLVGPYAREVQVKYPSLHPARAANEIVRRMMGAMVADVLSETQKNLAELQPGSANAIRHAVKPMVAFSESMQKDLKILREFLFRHVYYHENVLRVRDQASMVIRKLFTAFFDAPTNLPTEWQSLLREEGEGDVAKARIVLDYVAGMTDRYAVRAYQRLFGPQAIEGLPNA